MGWLIGVQDDVTFLAGGEGAEAQGVKGLFCCFSCVVFCHSLCCISLASRSADKPWETLHGLVSIFGERGS